MADPNFLSKIGGKVICWKEAGSLMRMGNVGNSCGKASVSKAMKEILSSWRTGSDESSVKPVICWFQNLCSLLSDAFRAGPLGSIHPKAKRNVDSLLKGLRTQTIVLDFLKATLPLGFPK